MIIVKINIFNIFDYICKKLLQKACLLLITYIQDKKSTFHIIKDNGSKIC